MKNVVVFVVSLSLLVSLSHAYSAKAIRLGIAPLVAHDQGSSTFDYAYNAAAVPFHPENRTLLLVRAQNNASATAGSKYATTPSVIAFAELDATSRLFSGVSKSTVTFSPFGMEEAFGTEDPRVLEVDGTFYLYSAVSVSPVVSRLSLATSQTPTVPGSWTRHGPLFPQRAWSKSGSLVVGPSRPYALLWGDSADVCGLHLAWTDDLIHYNDTDKIVLPCRSDHFDSDLMEGGPPALPLSDGNFFVIYNSARKTAPSEKPGYALEYNIGWAIINPTDATIIARGDEPLLSPELSWELHGLTPNVVFCEGMWAKRDEKNAFFFVYGAADTSLGLGVVRVSV